LAADGALGVPDTLANVLLDRVDRLDADARRVLSVASVIGRSFDAGTITAVAGMAQDLSRHLDTLVKQEIVFRLRRKGDHYQFKHALIQDAVYGRLLSDERKRLHLAIAEALETAHSGSERDVADVLVHHFRECDAVEKTIRYLILAGQKSLDVYAIDAARDRFEESLNLTEDDPGLLSNEETAELVLVNIRMSLLNGDVAKGQHLCEKYEALIDAVFDDGRKAYFYSLSSFCLGNIGDSKKCQEAASKALALAKSSDDEYALGHVLMTTAWIKMFFVNSDRDTYAMILEEASSACEIGRRRNDDFLASFAIYANAGTALVYGDPGECRRQADILLELAQADGNLMARQTGLVSHAWVSIFDQDPQSALNMAREASSLSMTPMIKIPVRALEAAALINTGDISDGFAKLTKTYDELLEKQLRTQMWLLNPTYGLAIFLNGDFSAGTRWIVEKESEWRELGFQATGSGLYYLTLGEIYLNVALSDEKPPLSVMLRNWWFLMTTLPRAKSLATKYFEQAVAIWRAYPAPSLLAWALCGLAEIAASRRNKNEAQELCGEAIELAESVNANATAERARKTLAEL
ncbi:MAG: hypothetical protein QGF53_02055, partial [Alphaproteobacteria bacterium]|nr:hypothetical protein [Alphaproteobacteria bacterium]